MEKKEKFPEENDLLEDFGSFGMASKQMAVICLDYIHFSLFFNPLLIAQESLSMWKEISSAAKRKMVGIFNGFLWNTNKEMIFRFIVFWVNMTWEKKCIEWTWNSVSMKKKEHNNFKFALELKEDCKWKC